ncbi:MAG: sugar phosphate isomerase/epimerase [Clostridiales bacterium]|nr:sugar phosphate isomerase/epimerase [Candidatus Apopatousia equi]
MRLVMHVSNDDVNKTPKETITIVKKAGFDGVFLQWYDGDYKKFDMNVFDQVKLAQELGLEIEFAHLSYFDINDIWLEEEKANKFIDRIKNDIVDLKKCGIKMGILHLTKSDTPPLYNEVGVKRLQELCNFAKQLGVKIAFENTRKQGYLEFVLDRIKNDNVGICLDAGHCHCYFKDNFNFEKFRNRIFALHLHDNFGEKDEHLLPFDGTIDWEKMCENIVKANYNGPITLECGYSLHYFNQGLKFEDFYNECYKRAKKLSQLMEKYKNKKEITNEK